MSISSRTATWNHLVELEPRLLELERNVRRAGLVHPDIDPDKLWYGRLSDDQTSGFKAQLCGLVGFMRDDVEREREVPILFSARAYSIAYQRLHGELHTVHPLGELNGVSWRGESHV